MIYKKEFYFIRHGQTDHNILEGKEKGNHPEDISLNKTGKIQAVRIEPIISALPVKSICYSPLKRVKETKEICCSGLSSVTHHELTDLSECGSEVWEKMTALGEKALSHSEEPVYGFMQRVLKGVNEALSKEGPVLIIAHGGIHWAICCFMGIEHGWGINNCVPVHFSISDQGLWRVKKLSV